MSESDKNIDSDETLESDDDLIAAITPDVMACLHRAKFFEKLDDLFCPEESSRLRAKCGETMPYPNRSWMLPDSKQMITMTFSTFLGHRADSAIVRFSTMLSNLAG